jgi:hypothetical protein
MPKNKKLYAIGLVIFLLTPFTINSAYADGTGGYTVQVTSCIKSGPTLGAIPTDVTAAAIIAGGSNTTALGSYYVDFDCDDTPLTVSVSMTALSKGSGDPDPIPFSSITYQAAIPAWLGADASATRPALIMSASAQTGLLLTPMLASTKATWIPSLTVAVPSNQAIGTYTSTITTSAA